jgi:hypothetical protein
MAAMTLGKKTGGEEEGEGQEEEGVKKEGCLVCYKAIVTNDPNNPAAPPLVCNHHYHAICLRMWVETCAIKCIEPACPYCRAPLPNMKSTPLPGMENI